MGRDGFPYGAPDFNDTTQLEFSSNVVSGVLTEDEVYRISADADCVIGFGEAHDTGFSLTNGAFLGADSDFYIKTKDNSKYVWIVASITTTSGICTISRMK